MCCCKWWKILLLVCAENVCFLSFELCGVETSTTKTRSQSSIFVSATSVSGLVSSRQHFNSFSSCVSCASFLVPVSQKLFCYCCYHVSFCIINTRFASEMWLAFGFPYITWNIQVFYQDIDIWTMSFVSLCKFCHTKSN